MPAVARKKTPATDIRRVLIAKVHIAKKQLNLDDVTYRAIISNQFNKDSSAKLSVTQLKDLVELLKKQGFKDRPRRKPVAPADQQNHDRERLLRKINALWASLNHLGVLRDGSEKALTAFAKRVSGGRDRGIAALAWLDGDAAYKVIEAMKKMAERDGGVCWETFKISTREGPVSVYRPRLRVLQAQWRIMMELKAPDASGLAAYTRSIAQPGMPLDLDKLSDEDQDRMIARTGTEVRQRLKSLGFDTVQSWKASR